MEMLEQNGDAFRTELARMEAGNPGIGAQWAAIMAEVAAEQAVAETATPNTPGKFASNELAKKEGRCANCVII